MRAFWDTLEKVDKLAFKTLDKVDQVRGRQKFRLQIEEKVKDVRAPQQAIAFED